MINEHGPIFLQKPTRFISEKDANKIEGSFIERKYDGQSLQIIFNSGDIRIYANSPAKVSKVFKEYTNSLPHIVNELREIDNILVDLDLNYLHLQGEVYSDHLPTDQDNFNYTVGVIKDHNSYERQLKEGLTKFVVYDIPSMGKFPYKDRYSYMKSLFDGHNFKYVSLAPILGINTNGSWIEYFNQMIEQGKEGIILIHPNSTYKFSNNSNGRNGLSWKIKVHNDDKEVLVTEIIEGTGKYKGNVGALKCIDGRGCEFKIGSFAIPDIEKQWIYDNATVPFLVEMKYMESTPESYRHPIMTRLRLDKNIDDWNPE